MKTAPEPISKLTINSNAKYISHLPHTHTERTATIEYAQPDRGHDIFLFAINISAAAAAALAPAAGVFFLISGQIVLDQFK